MRNLRSIYNKAVAEKRVEPQQENPFSKVYTGVKETRKRALSVNDISRLNTIDFERWLKSAEENIHERKRVMNLYKCWRYFFFCFHARGMSFVDMALLQKENVKGSFIRYYRRKTKTLIEVRITPAMQRIIDSFAHETRHSPYLFPIVQNSRKKPETQYQSALRIQNRNLKELSKLIGLKKGISTHVARHSWATIAKQQNVPIWVISEGLGHATEQMTYTYLASFDQSALDHANDLIMSAITSPAVARFAY